MKKLIISLTLMFVILSVSAEKAESPGEFSSPNIGVGVIVANLAKSVDFYTHVIGMTKIRDFAVTKEKATELGLSDKFKLDVTVLKLEDNDCANEWKLMSFGTKSNHPKQNFIHDDTGMQYITINVKHLNPFIDRIKKAGIDFLNGGESASLGNGNYFVLIQDPDGNFIEIIGPK